MENYNNRLLTQQAYESTLKNKEEVRKVKAERFEKLSIGCILYALFYTICLYKNYAGITHPFFVGGTLCCFWHCLKKCGVTAKKGSIFLTVAMAILGIGICTTDSAPLILLNKTAIVFLFCVLVLHSLYADQEWSIYTYMKTIGCLLTGSLIKVFTPVSDFFSYISVKKSECQKTVLNGDMLMKALIITAVFMTSIPFFFILIFVLCSADTIFEELLADTFSMLLDFSRFRFHIQADVIGVIFTFCMVMGCCYGGMIYANNREKIGEITKKHVIEWKSYIAITFTSVMAMIYVLFSFVQIFGLFLGCMKLPEGYTYAEYAREGFFQLLFVCIFNIVVVLAIVGLFKMNKGLQIILSTISVCTLIMVISSAYRMILYISSYHLTFLRVFVLWTLLMIAFVMIGVITRIYKKEFGLFRYLLVVLTVGYIGFSMSHPDFWIAKYNLAKLEQGEDVDTAYLYRHLSADAQFAFDGEIADEWGMKQYSYEGVGDFRTINLSRLLASILD